MVSLKHRAGIAKAESAEVFVDTSGFFTLLWTGDPAHAKATETMAGLARSRRRTLTTDYVLDETFTLPKARRLGRLAPGL